VTDRRGSARSPAGTFDQRDHRIRFDWGPNGLRTLAPISDTVVIVDVLRFTTAVDVAVGRGALVYPYRWADDGAVAFAHEIGGLVAVPGLEPDADHPWSLSPAALARLPAGSQLVLPSPNGSALAFGAAEHGARMVLAACLRNAVSIGSHLMAAGGSVAVIAAGERWRGQRGPLRPAVEDLLGAGAVLAHLPAGECSPEARAAAAAFDGLRDDLLGALLASGSGRELVARGWTTDVEWAADHDSSRAVPVLDGGAFRDRRA
jgi:2-phosphosulfolactate phosphatase